MPVIETGLPDERRCPCGAIPDTGRRQCGKCRARSRWHRRKAQRTRPVTPRRRHARVTHDGR